MNRNRLTWKDVSKKASGHPAYPDEGINHPAGYDDPEAHDYENGDTSSWAEDVRGGPYRTSPAPANPLDDGGYRHPAAQPGAPQKNASFVRSARQKAAKCVRLAQAVLGSNAIEAFVEDQALDYMDMADHAIDASLRRFEASTLDEDTLLRRMYAADEEEAPKEEEVSKEASKRLAALRRRLASEEEEEEEEVSKEASKRLAALRRRLAAEEEEEEPEGKEAAEEEEEESETEKAASRRLAALRRRRAAEEEEEEKKEASRKLAKRSRQANSEDSKIAQLEAKLAALEARLAGSEVEEDEETMLASMLAAAEEEEEEPEGKEASEDEEEAMLAQMYEDEGFFDEPMLDDVSLLDSELMSDPFQDTSTDLGIDMDLADESYPDFGEPMALDPISDADLSMLFASTKLAEEEAEEEVEEKPKTAAARTASSKLRPQPKKPTNGAKTVGQVRQASAEGDPLQKLWGAAPDISKIF